MPYISSYIIWGVVVITCFVAVTQSSLGGAFDGDPSCPVKCKCSAHFKRISCIHQGLYDIPLGIPPSATELYLGKNFLTVIKANSFQQLVNLTDLFLDNNKIYKIENGAFNGLRKLKRLTFTKNELRIINSPLAFQDLDSLEKLYFTQNKLKSVPDLRHVPNLTHLNLDNNNLLTAQLCKNSSFTKLSTIIFSNNPILDTVDRNDFACVNRDKVRKISFARCKLNTIEAGVFKFPHLQSLVLSDNTEFKPDMLRSIFSDVENSDLSSLDLCGVINNPKLLTNETFKGLETVPLLNLELCHSSNVETIQKGTFQYFKQLQQLDLSDGDLRQIEDTMDILKNLSVLNMDHNQFDLVPKLNIPNLRSLSLNTNNLMIKIQKDAFMGFPSLTNLSMKGCSIRVIEEEAFAYLDSLESLDLSNNQLGGNSIPTSSFDNMGQLVVLKLNNNRMTTIATERKIFDNLHNLEFLDLSGNQCGNISRLIFNNLLKLSRLILSGNALGDVIIADDNGQLFKHLNSLTILDLDNNRILNLHDTTFSDLTSLKRMNLSGNILTSWTAEMFNTSQHLETLDISKNKISTVGPSAITFLPANTSLNLTHNPFACWCDLRWFRRWISQLNDTGSKLTGLDSYTCNSPQSMAGKLLLNFDPDDFHLSASCFWFEIMIVSISAAIVIIIFIFFVIYRYRWSLRLRLYYMQRRWKKRNHSTYETLPDQFRHHIFVSYGPSSRDRDWVTNKLIRKTDRQTSEEERRRRDETDQNSINCCDETADEIDEIEANGKWEVFFEDRDLLPNQSEITTIGEAIYNSKRVVLVISKDYLNDGRRLAEIDLALQSRTDLHLQLQESIVLVLLDPDVDVKLPATLRSIVSRDEQLEWTENDQDGQKLFWDRLEERIRRELVPHDSIA